MQGSPQAVIRPLVVNKRRSLDAIEKRPEPQLLCSNSLPEAWPKTERSRSRRYSLPIEVIPEVNEPTGSDQSESSGKNDLSRLERHKDNLLHKAKELEREAYRALFEAEYLRWQAENNCQNFSLNSSIPAALSLKAEELGLQSRNLSLNSNSNSTTSLPIQSRSSTNLVEKRISSLSGRSTQHTASLNTKFLSSTPVLSPSPSSPLQLHSSCPASPFISSSHHDLEYDDSELRPFIHTGKRTLKKPRSRMMGRSRDNTNLGRFELRSFFAEDTSLRPKQKWFRFRCPFSFLTCCSRRKKYGPCRQSMGAR